MKKIILLCLLAHLFFLQSNAQYRAGIGTYVSSSSIMSSPNFPSKDSLAYELSIKVFATENSCYDIIGGIGKDYYRITLMKELHRSIFYPVDMYLGLGAHMGSWNKNHWTDGAKHNNMFAGIDGTFGLQITFFPIALSVGYRPVYDLMGGDKLSWFKQVGLHICFR